MAVVPQRFDKSGRFAIIGSMKRLILLILSAAIALCVSGCTGITAQTTRPPTRVVYVTLSPLPAETPAQEETAGTDTGAAPDDGESAEKRIADDSLSIAGGYRDIVFAGGETYLNLTAAQCEAVVDALAEKGYAAFDYTRSLAVRNPWLVKDFIDSVNAGTDASLTMLEITQDGGFLRRDFVVAGEERTLILTRLTWQQNDAVISAQGLFRLTEIYLNGNTLCFDFKFPDNPEGGNHDGHVETYSEIRLEP